MMQHITGIPRNQMVFSSLEDIRPHLRHALGMGQTENHTHFSLHPVPFNTAFITSSVRSRSGVRAAQATKT